MKKEIFSNNAPAPVGPYSQAVNFDNLVFISGQIPIDKDNNDLSEATVKEQTCLIFANISSILKEAGMSLDNVLKVEIFIRNMSDFTEMNNAYEKIFKGPIKPARSVVEVSNLPKNASMEISCIAGKDQK